MSDKTELPKEDLNLIVQIDELLGQLKNISQSVFELREHASLVLPDITPIEQQEQPKEEVKEAKRLIDKFGSYATDVAVELKLNDQYNNTYFWQCVTIEIDKINANKAL